MGQIASSNQPPNQAPEPTRGTEGRSVFPKSLAACGSALALGVRNIVYRSVIALILAISVGCESGRFPPNSNGDGGVSRQCRPLKVFVPAYPESFLNANRDQKVVVTFSVMPDGSVERAAIVSTPAIDLVDPTIVAVAAWTFSPMISLGGLPLYSYIKAEIRFGRGHLPTIQWLEYH